MAGRRAVNDAGEVLEWNGSTWAPPAAAPSRRRAVNDETGEILEFDGTQWGPAQPLTASQTVPFDPGVDRSRGAPARVRAAVGAAIQPQDRLATLQRFYPDARPYLDDNFVFTDPTTGRATLYNPPGVDMGDLPSIGPEIAETIGGSIGGALGAASSAPTGGMSAALSVPVGIGLGAAGGREVYNAAAESLMGTQDTRSVPEQLLDPAITAGANAIAQRAGDLVAAPVRSMFGNIARRPFSSTTSPQLVEDFRNLGVRPMAGAITGNKGMQQIEAGWLANFPGSAGVMQRAANEALEQLSGAVTRTARNYTGGRELLSPEQIGQLMQDASKGAVGRFQATQERIYTSIFARIPEGSLAPISRTQALLGEIQGMVARAPDSLGPNAREAIGRLEAALADAGRAGGGIDFATLRRIRTDLGKDIGDAPLVGRNTAANEYLQRMYGALSDDMNAFAVQTDPRLAYSLQVADRYTRFNMTQNIEMLNKLIERGAPEQVYRAMFGSATGITGETTLGGTTMRRLRRNYLPEEWDLIAGSMLGRLGLATPAEQGDTALGAAGDVFSPARFVTNWNRLDAGARYYLFEGTRYDGLRPALDALSRVSASLKDAAKMGNPSGTARGIFAGMSILAPLQLLLSGDPTGAVGAGSAMLSANVSARLLTNPRFVNWLTASTRQAQRGGSATGTITRLVAVAEANPEIREEIGQYLAALRAVPPLPGDEATEPE